MSDPIDERNVIASTLAEYPDAAKFILGYAAYCHGIDDIIDGERKSKEEILEVFAMAVDVFTTPFWNKYGHALYLTEKIINNDYIDSELMKESGIPWQVQQADVLRCSANNMLFAVLYLLCGREVARKVSLEIRACSYFRHHDKDGNPH